MQQEVRHVKKKKTSGSAATRKPPMSTSSRPATLPQKRIKRNKTGVHTISHDVDEN